jgi:hypothetical protein
MSEPFAPDYDKGSPQLRLPDELRAPMRAHFEQLRKWYEFGPDSPDHLIRKGRFRYIDRATLAVFRLL